MWSEMLTVSQAEHAASLIKELQDVDWARPLLAKIEEAGGLSKKSKPLLFELQFAADLHRRGLSAQYEYCAGVADTTVDFAVKAGALWLIELVRIEASDAAKRAVQGTEEFWTMMLSSDAEDLTQSPAGEMIVVQQKIGEKVFAHGKPIKFPLPSDGHYSAILVDMEGFLGGNVGDGYDYHQIAWGHEGLEDQYINWWRMPDGQWIPVAGIFEASNPLRSARTVQERIHFLGFVGGRRAEDLQKPLTERTINFWNPNLFRSQGEATAALQTFDARK